MVVLSESGFGFFVCVAVFGLFLLFYFFSRPRLMPGPRDPALPPRFHRPRSLPRQLPSSQSQANAITELGIYIGMLEHEVQQLKAALARRAPTPSSSSSSGSCSTRSRSPSSRTDHTAQTIDCKNGNAPTYVRSAPSFNCSVKKLESMFTNILGTAEDCHDLLVHHCPTVRAPTIGRNEILKQWNGTVHELVLARACELSYYEAR